MPTLQEVQDQYRSGQMSFQDLLAWTRSPQTPTTMQAGMSLDDAMNYMGDNFGYTPFGAAVRPTPEQMRQLLQYGVPVSIGETGRWLVNDGNGSYSLVSGDLSTQGSWFNNLDRGLRYKLAEFTNNVLPTHHVQGYMDALDKGGFLLGYTNYDSAEARKKAYDERWPAFTPIQTGDGGGGGGGGDGTGQAQAQGVFPVQSNIGNYRGDPVNTQVSGPLANNTNNANLTNGASRYQPWAGLNRTGAPGVQPYNVQNSGTTQGNEQVNLGLGDAAFNLGQSFGYFKPWAGA